MRNSFKILTISIAMTWISSTSFGAGDLARCDMGKKSQGISVQVNRDGKLPYDPTTFGFAHITFYNAVLGRMVRLNPNLTTQPGLLQDAFWDYKNRQYILRLKNDLHFHNGRKVVAEDIDFSLTRFFLTTKRADQVADLKQILGIETLKPGAVYRPWSVKGVQKIDSNTVAIKLGSSNPAFLYSLTDGWISLVPKEALENDYVTWKTIPIGAGPFKVLEVENGVVRTCRVSAEVPLAPNFVDFLSSPEATADLVGFVSSDFRPGKLKKVFGTGPIGYTGVFFNAKQRLAANPHFRNAVAFALKRKPYVAGVSDYSPLNETLTTNFYGRLNKPEKFDLEIARKELQLVPEILRQGVLKAHWFTGRKKLSALENRIIETFKLQMRQVGLNFDFSESAHPTFSDEDVTTVLRIDDRGSALPDPLVLFRAYERPAFLAPFFPDVQIPDYKKLLSRAAHAESLDVKSNAIYALSKFFDDHNLVIPIYERKTVYWINAEKIKELGIQTGITFDLERIRLSSNYIEGKI